MNASRMFGNGRVRGLLVGLGTAVVSAGWAIAQTPAAKTPKLLQPPVPPVGKSDAQWLPYVFAILVFAMIVAVNFIPSKRGHQD